MEKYRGENPIPTPGSFPILSLLYFDPFNLDTHSEHSADMNDTVFFIIYYSLRPSGGGGGTHTHMMMHRSHIQRGHFRWLLRRRPRRAVAEREHEESAARRAEVQVRHELGLHLDGELAPCGPRRPGRTALPEDRDVCNRGLL